MLTYVPWGMSESRSKPRSAMMESPGSNKDKRLDRCVSSLSEILPPYRGDKKVITPLGLTPTNNFSVLRFL